MLFLLHAGCEFYVEYFCTSTRENDVLQLICLIVIPVVELKKYVNHPSCAGSYEECPAGQFAALIRVENQRWVRGVTVNPAKISSSTRMCKLDTLTSNLHLSWENWGGIC